MSILLIIMLTNNVFAKKDAIEMYYKNLYNAEQLLIQENLIDALKSYQKAFQYKNNPFTKDLYNACICAIKVKKISIARNFFLKISYKGVPIDIFDSKYLQILCSTKKYKELYIQLYKNKEKSTKYKTSLLYQLAIQDQKIRHGSATTEEIDAVDKKNDSVLYEHIRIYGFPSEEEYMVGNRIDCYPEFSLVIWHQTKKNHFHEYRDILVKAIKEGKVSAEVATALIETHNGIGFGTKAFYRLKCDACSDTLKERITDRLFHANTFSIEFYKDIREKHLLDSIENTILKNNFMTSKNDFRLGCFSSVFPTYSFNDDKSLFEFMQTSTEFKLSPK